MCERARHACFSLSFRLVFSGITCESVRNYTSMKYMVLDFQKAQLALQIPEKIKADFSKSASRAGLSRRGMDVISLKNQVLYCVGFGVWFVFWFWCVFLISGVQLCCVHKINCM